MLTRSLPTPTTPWPQVEYAATVWDPHTQTNIDKVEAVQRMASRFVSGDYSYKSSVTSIFINLGWESLEHRRKQAKVTMMYRITHSLIAIPSTIYFQPLGATTRGHELKFLVPYCRINVIRDSFPSTIRLWNQLPENLVNTSSLDSFKGGLATVLFEDAQIDAFIPVFKAVQRTLPHF